MTVIRPATWARKWAMTEPWFTGPGMTTSPGLARNGMDHRSPGVGVSTIAGLPRGAGVSGAALAGVGAGLGDSVVIRRIRGGEVIPDGTIIGATTGGTGATATSPIQAAIFTTMTGDSEQTVSVALSIRPDSIVTDRPRAHEPDRSLTGSRDRCNLSGETRGVSRARTGHREADLALTMGTYRQRAIPGEAQGAR